MVAARSKGVLSARETAAHRAWREPLPILLCQLPSCGCSTFVSGSSNLKLQLSVGCLVRQWHLAREF